jgi:ankyrin repeat protein
MHVSANAITIFITALLGFSGCHASMMGEEGSTDMRGRASEMFPDATVRALAEAAERGDVRGIDRLLKQGVDVNATGRFGVTPLWWAIRTHNRASFAYLLAHGAQPNPSVESVTVMEMAAGYEDSAFLETVLPYKPDLGRVGGKKNETALETAIIYRRTHNLELLIKAGADLNLDDMGQIPMEGAARGRASYDYVYMMLQAGADPTKVHPPLSGNRGKNRLAVTIHNRIIDPNSEAYEWRERVIRFLKAKGIEAEKPPEEGPRTKPLPPDLR